MIWVGRTVTGEGNKKEAKKVFKNHIDIVSYALKMGVTRVYSLLQVIKHISSGLYLYESHVHQKRVTGKNMISYIKPCWSYNSDHLNAFVSRRTTCIKLS